MRAMLVICIIIFLSAAKEAPEKRVHKSKAYGDYFKHYLEQEVIDRQRAQEAVWNALFAGRYDLLPKLDRSNLWPLFRECVAEGAAPVSVPFARMLKEAASFRVMAFNEDHYDLRQRFFLLQNLEAFWAAGYRHIGYEALWAGEPGENFAETLHAGFFFNEAVMAATMRKARALGFEIFAYESQEPIYADTDWADGMNIREAGQAKRVAEYMSGVPENEKVLLWAGGHHITKRTDQTLEGRSIVWMAARLKRDHKIDAYTVDLTNCQYSAGNENAPARGYEQVDGNWQVSNLFEQWGVDAQLHLPVVVDGYTPDRYRKYIGRQTEVPNALRALSDTLFVQAYASGEPETATAYDSILMLPGEALPLYLPAGVFKLVAYGSDGTRLGAINITVE